MIEPRIERCVEDQSAVLTEIAHAAKRHWGYPERWIVEWRDSLTVKPEMVRTHATWCCRVPDSLAGFFVLIHEGERMELEHMWVRPEFIGSGIGRRLMDQALVVARTAGARVIDITSDPHAEGFYLHVGAERVGQVFAPVDGTRRHLPRLALEVTPSR